MRVAFNDNHLQSLFWEFADQNAWYLAGHRESCQLLISPGSLCQPPDVIFAAKCHAVISPHGRIISHGRTSAGRAETAGIITGRGRVWLTSVPWTGGVALWWQLRARGMLIFLIRITLGWHWPGVTCSFPQECNRASGQEISFLWPINGASIYNFQEINSLNSM